MRLYPQDPAPADDGPVLPADERVSLLRRLPDELEAECNRGLFRHRRLLLAAIPRISGGLPTVLFVVRGPGTPIDEEPLPDNIGGRLHAACFGSICTYVY